MPSEVCVCGGSGIQEARGEHKRIRERLKKNKKKKMLIGEETRRQREEGHNYHCHYVIRTKDFFCVCCISIYIYVCVCERERGIDWGL